MSACSWDTHRREMAVPAKGVFDMKQNHKARRANLLLVLGLLALGIVITLCLLLTERTGATVR